jgi:hypothetical protein
MSVVVDAISQQMDESIYNNPSNESKFRLASECDNLKRVAMVVAVATPIFAFFLPYVFGVLACITIGIGAYEIFNIADNLGDAAKLSAEGALRLHQPNIEILLDGTLTGWLFHRSMKTNQK